MNDKYYLAKHTTKQHFSDMILTIGMVKQKLRVKIA
jgi:hypothetical protein